MAEEVRSTEKAGETVNKIKQAANDDQTLVAMIMSRGEDEGDLLEPDPVVDTACPGCCCVSPLATTISIVCLPLYALKGFGCMMVPEKTHVAAFYFGESTSEAFRLLAFIS